MRDDTPEENELTVCNWQLLKAQTIRLDACHMQMLRILQTYEGKRVPWGRLQIVQGEVAPLPAYSLGANLKIN
jgi:hypothetical protein